MKPRSGRHGATADPDVSIERRCRRVVALAIRWRPVCVHVRRLLWGRAMKPAGGSCSFSGWRSMPRGAAVHPKTSPVDAGLAGSTMFAAEAEWAGRNAAAGRWPGVDGPPGAPPRSSETRRTDPVSMRSRLAVGEASSSWNGRGSRPGDPSGSTRTGKHAPVPHSTVPAKAVTSLRPATCATWVSRSKRPGMAVVARTDIAC